MVGAAAFHASSFLTDFLSQDLATSLWALSRLGYYDAQLYNDFADEVRRQDGIRSCSGALPAPHWSRHTPGTRGKRAHGVRQEHDESR